MPQLSKHLPSAISQTFTSAILQAYASWEKKNRNNQNRQHNNNNHKKKHHTQKQKSKQNQQHHNKKAYPIWKHYLKN